MPFGAGSLVFIGSYFLLLVLLGWLAKNRHESGDLTDFYLANRGIGGLFLLLTLYATQYSGNSLIGYPGEAYRIGFAWIMSVGFMMSVVVVYLTFAPRLFRLSRQFSFVTPGDWIDHRFGSPLLSLLASIVFLVTITNFLLAQLMAMGHTVAALSAEAVPYWAGVVGLGLVVVLYESVGGMRAVVWTDALQAGLLFLGIGGMLFAVLHGQGGIGATSQWILDHQPEKAVVPDSSVVRTWFSTLLLVGFSAAIYPQAIQRIFAARSSRALRTSLSVMAFMPLLTLLPICLVGILAIQQLQGLEGIAADRVLPELMRLWAGQSAFVHFMGLLVLTGAIAAIMSTADSMLLSLSSIVAKDVLAKHGLRNASSERLARIGKRVSWVVMLLLIAVAFEPRISLWGLTELKLEILLQVSPLFVLGACWRGFTARGALAGLVVGLALALLAGPAGYARIWDIHAGVFAWLANLAVGVAASAWQRRSGRR